MDFNDIFVSRDKSFVSLNEAADYLGRRLRENLVIFNIDDSKSEVTFISEKNNIIKCSYGYENEKVVLENFVVRDTEDVYSDERVDEAVTQGVSNFVRSLHESRYDKAESSFQDLLDSFTVRGRIDETRRKLEKKIARFGETYNIVETRTWAKFQEVLPIFEKFVADKAESLFEDQNVMEGLRLLAMVAKAYDMPKLQVEDLGSEMIVVEGNNDKTLYEMICNTELIRKELLESKDNFASMWATNGAISNLAAAIYASDEDVYAALQEAVKEVPYLALANKSELVRVMESTFEVNNSNVITQKEIKDFVSNLYEMKKPLKEAITETLNDKYGVNIASLKFVPSFKGLSQIHGEVFSRLSESCESGILADVLVEMSTMMARKGGVEVLDVAEVIVEAFEKAGINLTTQEFSSLEEVLEESYEDVVASGGRDYMGRKQAEKDAKKAAAKKAAAEKDEEEKPVQEKKLSPEQSKEMDTDKDGDIDGEDLENLRDKKKKGAAKKDEEGKEEKPKKKDGEKEDDKKGTESEDGGAMTAESKEVEEDAELDLGGEGRTAEEITKDLADIIDSLDIDSLTKDGEDE